MAVTVGPQQLNTIPKPTVMIGRRRMKLARHLARYNDELTDQELFGRPSMSIAIGDQEGRLEIRLWPLFSRIHELYELYDFDM